MLVTAVGAIATACLVELEHRIACGDGYIDRAAGEECEPDDLASVAGACALIGLPTGIAKCGDSCEIIADVETCTQGVPPRCGDGSIDVSLGETCDGHSDVLCPGDTLQLVPCLACRLRVDACPPYCGDGTVGPGEECDDGDAVLRHDCRTEVHSPHQGLQFGSGNASCRNCLWDTSECSFCGNGTREGDEKLVETDPEIYAMHEACDGEQFELNGLSTGQCAEGMRLNLVCTASCEAEPRQGEPPCCLISGAVCDPDDSDRPCCTRDDPGGAGPACEVDPSGVQPPICR